MTTGLLPFRFIPVEWELRQRIIPLCTDVCHLIRGLCRCDPARRVDFSFWFRRYFLARTLYLPLSPAALSIAFAGFFNSFSHFVQIDQRATNFLGYRGICLEEISTFNSRPFEEWAQDIEITP